MNEMHAYMQSREIRYWRDKRGHEVDFVLARRAGAPIAIECKWSASEFDPANVRSFLHQYPLGAALVVARDVDRPFRRRHGDISVEFVGLRGLIERLAIRHGIVQA